jgi:hypothetical protein
LDISPHPCDYYLVLTGPAGQARVLPWIIDSVFLFERERLLATLRARGVEIGIATSARKADWEAARIFPPQQTSPLLLSGPSLPSWHSSHHQHPGPAEPSGLGITELTPAHLGFLAHVRLICDLLAAGRRRI